ncbi:MAG: hypothetical protein J6T99_09470 [Oscillospiraceae bacterium]|nr:hypothetical protein [Oscillospiraceae bacterium]
MDDLISRQAAIDEFYKYPNIRWLTLDILKKLKELPSAESPTTWHETFEDDLTTFPDDDRMVLVSFSNCNQPMLGRFWDDAWRVGDEDETFLQYNLFVDGWWELPKKPKEET